MRKDTFALLAAIETDLCVAWPWPTRRGYGYIQWEAKNWGVHVLALTLRQPPPFEGAKALHKPVICHNSACMNYRHLYWGTQADNMRDRRLDGTIVPVTHCLRGHPYDEANTYVNSAGCRACRACDAARAARIRAATR